MGYGKTKSRITDILQFGEDICELMINGSGNNKQDNLLKDELTIRSKAALNNKNIRLYYFAMFRGEINANLLTQ